MTDVAVGFSGTILTLGVSAMLFVAQQRQANRVPFLQKQLDLCFEVAEALARLATETDDGKWEDARKTFWRLYLGQLSIVEDATIESLMVEIGEIVPRLPCKTPELPRPGFERASFRLALAVRILMKRSWNIKLPVLTSKRQQ